MDYHPDFEEKDNAGRTTEQIHSYNAGTPTRDDRRRWAAVDRLERARQLHAEGAGEQLQPAGHSIRTWTDLLARCTTVAQAADMVRHVLFDDEGARERLHEFLDVTAAWFHRQGDGELAAELERGARSIADVVASTHRVDDTLANITSADREPEPTASAGEPGTPRPPSSPPAGTGSAPSPTWPSGR
ncbi:hypothetical protein [Streptomyces sp. SBT349]|uniref:hypothetical protein n=1 Tax=Streptomyces sp. SBT349 TaxID=1580539 RepID=UPI00066D23C6|nr:hypothetical protein [Streptomyces sp. SBT349]